MFVQHYLDRMFPLSKSLRTRLSGTGLKSASKSLTGGWDWERVDEDSSFMGSVVQGLGSVKPEDKLGREDWEVSYVGESGAEDEDGDEDVVPAGGKNRKSNGAKKKGSLGGATLKEEGITLTNGMTDGEIRRARAFRSKKEFKVKNLSRLWLYRNGKSPTN